MSRPQLTKVLVPPPTAMSARKSDQVPFAVNPPNVPSNGLAESFHRRSSRPVDGMLAQFADFHRLGHHLVQFPVLGRRKDSLPASHVQVHELHGFFCFCPRTERTSRKTFSRHRPMRRILSGRPHWAANAGSSPDKRSKSVP